MSNTPRHPALVLAALASGFVMASIDSTVVNVAAVSIGTDFGSSLSALTWVVDVYVLAFASLLLLGGSLATAYGSRRLYLIGMVVFLGASLVCALAPAQLILIAARAVQGAGAAMFMPSSLSLLVTQFTNPGQRARMLGLWSAMVAMSAAIGPTLGGVLVSTFGWRSIFLINIPVVVAGIALTLTCIPQDPGSRERISPSGHITLLVVVCAAAFVLIQGHSSGFGTPLILGAIGVLVLGTVVLALQQRRTAHPVMPWRLFRNRAFATPNLIGFLYSAALYGGLYLMGLFFQNARQAGPLEAGLQLLPMTICFPLGNVLYTRIHHRVSNPVIMTACLLLAGAATLLLVGVGPATPYWYLALALGVANSGAGLVTAAMTAATVAAAEDRYANYAGAVLNTNRQVGVLIGIAIIGLVLQASTDWYAGLHLAVAIVAATYLLAGLAALNLVVATRSVPTRPVVDGCSESA
ncbi:MFS transporter [Enemella evansiae]|uniref:MFS transporter n=1 Tax=Enemella evansiae TaxID=2016499 RepID=UPI000B964305|nr:MFS transporter [Enemella evansiae]OYN93517.1 MFS transporter [Enemella evansiae]